MMSLVCAIFSGICLVPLYSETLSRSRGEQDFHELSNERQSTINQEIQQVRGALSPNSQERPALRVEAMRVCADTDGADRVEEITIDAITVGPPTTSTPTGNVP